MLLVAARQLGDPVTFVVLAKADDAALRHERPIAMSGRPYWVVGSTWSQASLRYLLLEDHGLEITPIAEAAHEQNDAVRLGGNAQLEQISRQAFRCFGGMALIQVKPAQKRNIRGARAEGMLLACDNLLDALLQQVSVTCALSGKTHRLRLGRRAHPDSTGGVDHRGPVARQRDTFIAYDGDELVRVRRRCPTGEKHHQRRSGSNALDNRPHQA